MLVPYIAATTLFFVDSRAIVYSARSDDPIFPVTYSHRHPVQFQVEWLNSKLASTVLGCTDEKYVRDQTSQREWYVINEWMYERHSNHRWNLTSPDLIGSTPLPYSKTDITALRLIGLVLRFSDTGSAAIFARSQWLDAASRVVQSSRSLPLDPQQWQLESQKLFNTSLARIQTDVLYMARGRKLDPNISAYELLDDSLVDPCRMIKIHADGSRNVSIIGFAGMLGLALGLWLVTVETGDTVALIWLFRIAKSLVVRLWSLARSAWWMTMGVLSTLWSLVSDAPSWIRFRMFYRTT